ncbi:hypothetical protein TCAL_02397 [Tigriopus californicus]|uniref:Nucleoside diphosphate kinase-like domain-containing protein n=1 Tax=Tigriopus californicus TaxID=6832 RepID=A0A553P091_TIGCA|nr:uncharacterized protein LOC131887125 [Tigriopus californicus]TRY71114.1 hypothetical protein TCAL_02397 [Tigriopus californicus]|eukprot:TCALIF_02397-PA protein Name:"Similar to NME5 Nucleoside diphosphate kinase homolog 5 (Homo sapiens)" AED:0.01 eAED:0.01 QI:0/-1/0/1/-1/1/1/0/241
MASDEVTLEGTLALIKPDALARENLILERIREERFLIVEKKRLRFSRETAAKFYENQKNEPHFSDLIDYITSGDVIALCLARENGIDKWNEVIGPPSVSDAMKYAKNSLRARFGDPLNDMINSLHGSDSPGSSEREIEIIFPHILQGDSDEEDHDEEEEEDVVRQEARLNTAKADRVSQAGSVLDEIDRTLDHHASDNKGYLHKAVCPTLIRGLSEMYEVRPRSPISWLADWLTDNNPYQA